MQNIVYPRQPGSDVRVDEDKWVQDGDLGQCPACGSIGIEELHIQGDGEIAFYCSDVTCRDTRRRRTTWAAMKPQEMIDRELRAGWSWNAEHFPGQSFPIACPD